MANRYLEQFRLSFEKQVVEVFCKVTIGSAGACTLSRGKGIASITHNSAGKYTIVLQDNYYRLLDVSNQAISSTAAQAAPCMTVVSEDVAGTTKAIVLQFRAIDNSTATDPASGEVLLLRFALGNSSI